MVESSCRGGPAEETLEAFKRGIAHGQVRGSYLFVFENALYDVCGEWGFDPRDIKTNCVSVWHALDIL